MAKTLFDSDEAGRTLPQLIEQHVKRYRLTIPHVVERLFIFSSQLQDHTAGLKLAREELDKLVEEGRLARLKGKSAFAKQAYLYPGQAITEGDELSKLWFCCMQKQRRYYASFEEVKPLFTAEEMKPPYHNYSHALSHADGGPVLYRLYLCRAEKKNAREQLKAHIGQKAGRREKACKPWIDQGSYGVAVLVQSEKKKEEIVKALNTSYGGRPPLNDLARFLVSVVPSESTFAQAIERYEKEAWA